MTIQFPQDPSTATNYKLWRKDVLIWKKLTNIEENKKGLALQYVCRGSERIHEAVTDIPTENVECSEGFDNVLTVIDELLKIDQRDIEMRECSEFNTLTKEEDQTMAYFIDLFDSKYCKIKEHGNSLSNNMLIDKLFKAAHLTKTEEQMINLVYPEATYEDVKKALKHMFGGNYGYNVQAQTNRLRFRFDAF